MDTGMPRVTAAELAPNVDPTIQPPGQSYPSGLITPDQVTADDAATMAAVGVLRSPENRAATYIQRDYVPLCLAAWNKDIELLPLSVALERYAWLREQYNWRAVPRDLDAYTAQCAQTNAEGFYLRVKAGAKLPKPVEACLYLASGNSTQMVHNIIILEEGAELALITGCTTRHGVTAGTHFGVTESYIGPNATLTCTMVHNWEPDTLIRAQTGTIVEQGGRYMDTYCSLRPGRDIQTNPRTWLAGTGASAKYLTIILGAAGSTINTGGEVYLNGNQTSAELAHRAVCTGGHITQRGLLYGNAPCHAHVDCAGIVLETAEQGVIRSVPGLQSHHAEARMSHEASIGKISPEQVEYLQSRGLSEREAISLIIRGFLGVDTVAFGTTLDRQIAEIAELAGHGEK